MSIKTTLSALVAAASALLLSNCESLEQLSGSGSTEAPSYVAMETNSGRILYATNANVRRPIGMLANIATGIIVLDWVKSRGINMDTILTVPETVTQWPRTNLLKLKPGDRISLRDALHSTIMWDDSACAATLARACGSTISSSDPDGAFVAQLNQMARTIGMTNTRFKGSNGAVISYASARDMALLGMYAIENPGFQSICSQRSYTATINGTTTRQITNSNSMLAQSNVDGVKAARSKTAGACLIASSKRASVKRYNPQLNKESTYAQRLLVVVLGMPSSQKRYNMASDLLRDSWGAWEDWQKTNDFQDPNKFIILPH
ncbi:MAG: D-alanyl-D-alanine carboxypeptidase [Akkermansia sp.]|nr:D-alanyl-D-alanine carboxypeptidase [Akkermansia sp.]